MPKESDPKAIQISYSDAFPDVLAAVEAVGRSGDFVADGVEETPMPTIRVGDGEVLSFPVPAAQSKTVIKSAGEKAPYGRGDQTLVDESVRRVWQVSPATIAISGKGWESTFKKILGQLESGLGREKDSIKAVVSSPRTATRRKQKACSAP